MIFQACRDMRSESSNFLRSDIYFGSKLIWRQNVGFCFEKGKKNHNLFDKSIFYINNLSDVLISPFSSFIDEKIKVQVLHKHFRWIT